MSSWVIQLMRLVFQKDIRTWWFYALLENLAILKRSFGCPSGDGVFWPQSGAGPKSSMINSWKVQDAQAIVCSFYRTLSQVLTILAHLAWIPLLKGITLLSASLRGTTKELFRVLIFFPTNVENLQVNLFSGCRNWRMPSRPRLNITWWSAVRCDNSRYVQRRIFN